MKTVYDLHRFWTSMSAIFGFTFHIGRMTEVLTPDICIELTGSWQKIFRVLTRLHTSEEESSTTNHVT